MLNHVLGPIEGVFFFFSKLKKKIVFNNVMGIAGAVSSRGVHSYVMASILIQHSIRFYNEGDDNATGIPRQLTGQMSHNKQASND